MENRKIYMDYSATTPVKQEVVDEMMPYFTQYFGNASSFHAFGREAKTALDKARGEVNSLKKVVESVLKLSGDTSDKILSIAHANCPEKALKVREMLEKENQFKKVMISEVGPVMGTYSAKGAILVSIL